MAATAHPLATRSALDCLRDGGTAVDAAISANTVLNVAQPDMCGIGGDLFALVYAAKDGKVHAVNASGRAPREVSAETLRARFSSMPRHGPCSVTVPGCVSGWHHLHQRFGRSPWPSLLEDAILMARDGVPMTARVAARAEEMRSGPWQSHEGAHQLFFPDGPAREGQIMKMDALADSFRRIAEEGPQAVYGGALGEAIAQHVAAQAYPLSITDLKVHRAEWTEPVRLDYRAVEVLTTRPNSQGITALLMLDQLARLDPRKMDGPEDPRWLLASLAAKRAAYRGRERVWADPDLLATGAVEALVAYGPPDGPDDVFDERPEGDTTALVVADAAGNVAVLIQSLYQGFGSGEIVPNTGIILQNRGAQFSLDPTAQSVFSAGRRPPHTLMATMVLKDGRPALGFATMGGDVQPQTTVQVLTRVIDFGQPITEAVAAPRWVEVAPAPGEAPRLLVEDRLGTRARAAWKKAGHAPEILPSFAHETGHAQAVAFRPDGLAEGTSDPRGDGVAFG